MSRMIRLFSPCMQMMSLPVSRALELLLLAASCMHAMPSCVVQCSAAPLWRPSLPSPAHSGRAVPACCVCVCVPAPVVPVPAGLPPLSSLRSCIQGRTGLPALDTLDAEPAPAPAEQQIDRQWHACRLTGAVAARLGLPSLRVARVPSSIVLYSTPSVSFYMSLDSVKLHYPATNKKKRREYVACGLYWGHSRYMHG
jgi:hypothetical protein